MHAFMLADGYKLVAVGDAAELSTASGNAPGFQVILGLPLLKQARHFRSFLK